MHAKNLCNTLLEKFEKDLVALKGKDFAVNVKTLSTKLVEDVNFQVSLMSLQGDLSLDEITLALTKDIDAIVAKQQVIELNSIVNKSVKRYRPVCPSRSSLSWAIQTRKPGIMFCSSLRVCTRSLVVILGLARHPRRTSRPLKSSSSNRGASFMMSHTS